MDRYALVESGIVVNVIAWDGVEYDEETGIGWSPPAGVTVVKVGSGDVPSIGLGYSNGVFERPTDTIIVEPASLTRAEIEALRLRAYADPITGSDRYFAEAARVQAMGGTVDEIEAARASGATRSEEIQALYPWPV
jgi:hypothetical protein